MSVDYRHVQAQPEWEEASVISPDLDHFNPDWSRIDLAGYHRPLWFFDPSLGEIEAVAESIRATRAGESELPPAPIRSTKSNHGAVRSLLESLGLLGLARLTRQRVRVLDHQLSDSVAKELIAEFARVFPAAKPLTIEDVAELYPRATAHGPLFKLYPLVQAYSLDPILVMLNDPTQPLICFEHGTMREFPFEDSARGRLYGLALKRADCVFITNADCNRSAERLQLKNYRFVPHPVDEELYRPAASPLGEKLRREHDCDYVLVAPARHHWKHSPPGLENSWFKRNDILIRALGEYFRIHPESRALVVFFEWGQEVELSKQLIAECGFASRVRWEPIASKPVMRDYYNAADIVFDQFNDGIGTFGTVVPEALASGKPVILNYKEALHHWCYPELPPALNAANEAAILAHLEHLLNDRAYRLALGERGRDWFMRNHSSRLVAQRMIDAYLDISDRRGWGWRN